MIAVKKRESENKRQAVQTALKELISLNDPLNHPVTKAGICKRANVSKTFLYSHPDLLRMVEEAVHRQGSATAPPRKKFTPSDASKEKLIESLKRTVQKLREENQKLKRENEILYGRLARKN